MSRMLAALALLAASAGAAYAQAVGLVTDLVGGAGPAILSEVVAEKEIRLAKGAKLTVLYYSSGHEFIFEGPALIRFRPQEPLVIEGTAPKRRALTAKGITVRAGGVAPATFVMRGPKATPPAKGAPLSERVAYAVWLEQSGQKGEAARLWKALAVERPGSERLRALAAGK
jgi:hypothetical protein